MLWGVVARMRASCCCGVVLADVRSTVLFPRQPASRHPNCFRFLLLHGRWAACDQVRQRSDDPTYRAVSTTNVNELCVAVLQVYGVRRTAD